MIEGSIAQKLSVGLSQLINFEVAAVMPHKSVHSVRVVGMVLEYWQLNLIQSQTREVFTLEIFEGEIEASMVEGVAPETHVVVAALFEYLDAL